MENTAEISPPETQDRVESNDGSYVYLFRYDNPGSNDGSHSNTTREDLIGKWFTDSPESLKTYILQRKPGGNIVVVPVKKQELENLRASNHETAKETDIEYDNFIVPDELLSSERKFPLTIEGSGNNKFKLNDIQSIKDFITDIVNNLQAQTDSK